MTANHAHTPSQEMFRLAYKHILDNWLITPEGRQQALGEYDRMIAQVEATAEQRGAEEGWDLAIDYAWDDSSIYEADAKRAKAANPYRADQVEGDDE